MSAAEFLPRSRTIPSLNRAAAGCTAHPSAILRAPDEDRASERAAFVADLRRVAEALARLRRGGAVSRPS
jgi:hypothetical protein